MLDSQNWKFMPSLVVGRECINMPNLVKIGQTVKKIWCLFDFLRRQLSAILDFQIPEILTANRVQRTQMHHHATLCQNRLNL